jgi:formylglycine-generating enzyme required for sulfatase activity
MARICLCHASEDKGQVREVYQRLAAIEGFEPWLDEEDLLSGQDWAYEIPRALEASDFILIFFSSTSVGRRGYVQREMKLALDALQEIPAGEIFTIPVRLDECEVPEPFRRYHYANLFDPRGFDRLVTALHRGLEQRGEQVPDSLEIPPTNPEPTTTPPAATDDTQPTPPPSFYEAPKAPPKSEPAPITPSEPPAQPSKKQPRPQSLWRNPTIIAALITAIATIMAATMPEVRMFIAQKLTISQPRPVSTGTGPDHSAEPFSIWKNSIGMEFVLIPAGTFTMGSPDSDRNANNDEKPAHQVTISKPFYMSKYEVTQAQWKAVMGNNPSRFKDKPEHPVENVSWHDVQAFIKKLNAQGNGVSYHLPTEAQWEYAVRAGHQGVYSFGDDAAKLGEYAWYDQNSGGETHPVGTRKPNAWGLYDMHGNVWEWVQDWYDEDYYHNSPKVDPQGPDAGADRVYRGGGWGNAALVARSASRLWSHPGVRDDDLGFRCLSSVPSK